MKSHLPTFAFLLLAIAHLDWARLALTGGLPAFGVLLVVEGIAFGLLAWKREWVRPLAGVAIAIELAGISLAGISGIQLVYNLVIVAGLALLAWRKAFSPGAYVALAGYSLYAAASVANGQTFLLLGLALCVLAWAILSWSAFVSGAAQPSSATSAEAHAGGRP